MEDAHERAGWEEVLPPAELTAFCETDQSGPLHPHHLSHTHTSGREV